MLSIYAQSLQYVAVPVSNNEGINPTSASVAPAFAFLGPFTNVASANEAVPNANTTYYSGIWQSNIQGTPPNEYIAACLVGPNGTVALGTGTYLVIVKITASPETPVLYSGPMVVN